MIIGIVDHEDKNRDLLIEEMKEKGLIVLNGEFKTIKEKAVELLKYNPDSIIVLNYPNLIEDGFLHEVDKVIDIIRFYRSLNEKQMKLNQERERIEFDSYLIGIPESEREKTSKEWKNRLNFMKKELNAYIKLWKEEKAGIGFSDLEIRKIVEEMIEKSNVKLNGFKMNANMSLPYVARYRDWLHDIVFNQFPIKIDRVKYDRKGIQLVAAHELGHAIDPELEDINKDERILEKKLKEASSIDEINLLIDRLLKLTLKAENNAYNLCYQFLSPEHTKEEVERARKNNEKGYIGLFEKKRERFILNFLNKVS